MRQCCTEQVELCEYRREGARLQEAAEKLFAMVALKGRGFSRAAEAL
jgi:hypothetical protein